MIPPFQYIFSVQGLLSAFFAFRKGKTSKADVQEFSVHLYENIKSLSQDLLARTYRHGKYIHFKINDPKPRDIHKASVRDRVVHRALYDALYYYFENLFIYDSHSARVGHGTHSALRRFELFARKESKNYREKTWVLQCDVRKCFASVDHATLKNILSQHIEDGRLRSVLYEVIDSFSAGPGRGIPLGNLTSQLFINIYLSSFDHFMKREIKARKYIRYADDFVVISQDGDWLRSLIPHIARFLREERALELHPRKVLVQKLHSGVDFLGWVHFPAYRVLRTKTKQRMFKKLENGATREQIASYRGLLSHGNAYKLIQKLPIIDE